jgi:maltodextrin utilization protein YvdJ
MMLFHGSFCIVILNAAFYVVISERSVLRRHSERSEESPHFVVVCSTLPLN